MGGLYELGLAVDYSKRRLYMPYMDDRWKLSDDPEGPPVSTFIHDKAHACSVLKLLFNCTFFFSFFFIGLS